MIILLTGVACVGKSTIGRKFAKDVGFQFFDLDVEIERFYGKTISRLQEDIIGRYSWRAKGAPVLKNILEENRHKDTVVALPPSGLMDPYLRVIKKSHALVVVLTDTPDNILKRITFFDVDSQPINKVLKAKEKKYYLNDIKKDITYYKRSYSRAHFQLDIAGLDVGQAATALNDLLGLEPPVKKAKPPKLRVVPKRAEQACVTHTNRKGKVYYLHVGKTKKGNPRYHFSTKEKGNLGGEIPEGYEIYENPNSQVYLRKIQPKLVGDEEIQLVDTALKEHARPNAHRLDVRGEVITIFESSQTGRSMDGFPPFFSRLLMQEWADQHAHFTAVLRFILRDDKKRLFTAERYCFLGSIEDWMPLLGGGPAPLKDIVDKYVPHLGQESFFDLM
jgi:shikimate kinase